MSVSLGGREIQDLLASFSDGIVISDDSSCIVWMNPVAEYQLGISARDWVGKTTLSLAEGKPELTWIFEDEKAVVSRCWDVVGCETRECPLWGEDETECWTTTACSVCATLSDDGKPGRPPLEKCSRCQVYKSHTLLREREVVRAPNDKIMLQISNNPIRSARGARIGRLRILRDVSQERELARLKDDFLSGLSHELRTPLTSIRSYADILLNYPDTDPDTQKEFLRIIRGESERLDQMIDDMAELHRLELTRSVWNNRHILIQDVVQSVLRDQEQTLEKKKIDCRVQMDPNCPVIWADFDRLHQVLSSLLRNLLKRTDPAGSISLKAASVEGKREGDQKSLIHVTLSSRNPRAGGPGSIPEASSGSSEKKAKSMSLGREKSLGLGIVLCKQILDQCGGNLWMDNGDTDLGHTIHFVLPTRGSIGKIEPEEILSREMLAGPIPYQIQKGKKGILVVDDDPSLVNALVFALTKEGYHVHSTTSARRGLEIVKQVKPDLIISDITMPEMDGYAFLQELQKDEAAKLIPFIFISAKGEPGDRIKGLKTGVDDYLSKPFEIKELAARVEALLVRVERLKDLSRFDGLTGAMTRRAFEEILPRELRKAQINGQPLSLAMADLDHFKDVNDNYGHLIGDFVLSSFVRFLKKNLREDATLVRYGGEEFCIVMPDVQKHVAYEILERVKRMLAGTSFVYEKENLHIRVTCSFGVSGFPEDSGNPEGLIEKADEALYRAKSLGRNSVVLYGEMPPPPSSGEDAKRRNTSGHP